MCLPRQGLNSSWHCTQFEPSYEYGEAEVFSLSQYIAQLKLAKQKPISPTSGHKPIPGIKQSQSGHEESDSWISMAWFSERWPLMTAVEVQECLTPLKWGSVWNAASDTPGKSECQTAQEHGSWSGKREFPSVSACLSVKGMAHVHCSVSFQKQS